jgi:hypothetical protein
MKINHRFIIASVLFLTVGGLIVFGTINVKQSKLLKSQQALITKMKQQVLAQKELLEVDTLLIEGRYQDALERYSNHDTGTIEDGQFGVGLRMAIAQKLLKYEDDLSNKALTVSNEIDSVSLNTKDASDKNKVDQLDSLNFVLSKTKMQLAKLKRQLQHKSFGEYLTFTNSRGSQVHYVGQVKDGKASGYGVAILNTGSRYVGEWKDNIRQGEGTFYWKDGEYYEGHYEGDKRNGQGTYYWPNGEKYVGQWKDDRRSGKGAFFAKDGKLMTQGVWEDDKMITDTTKPKKRSKTKEMAAL